MGATVTISTGLAALIAFVWFASVVIAAYAAINASRVEITFPSADQLQRLAEQTQAQAESTQHWLEVADRVNGTKAAVAGAAGVFLGAAGGLTADWISTGTMSSEAIWRSLGVLGGLTVISIVVFRVINNKISASGGSAGRTIP